MNLFLASSSKSLSLIESHFMVNKRPHRVIFIENASDKNTGDKWWIKADKDAFLKMNCELICLDLREISKEQFLKELDSSDIIHFCGGSVLYLISLIKNKGIKDMLVEKVKSGNIVYSGTSAGSMIASRDLSLSRYDEEEDKDTLNATSEFSGLGFVDFLIIPHTNNKDFVKSNVQMVEKLSDHLQPLIFMDDNRAVLVKEDNIRILSV